MERLRKLIFEQKRAIAGYIARIMLFCLMVKYAFLPFFTVFAFLSIPLMILIDFISYKFAPLIPKLSIIVQNQDLMDFAILWIKIASFFTLYFIAKICGIFKKLDKMNFFIALFIVIVINFLVVFICKNHFLTPEYFYDLFELSDYTALYSLSFAYFLYKFFGFLTRKYPVPFEKFGYWSSKEFWGGLVRKILRKIKLKK